MLSEDAQEGKDTRIRDFCIDNYSSALCSLSAISLRHCLHSHQYRKAIYRVSHRCYYLHSVHLICVISPRVITGSRTVRFYFRVIFAVNIPNIKVIDAGLVEACV